LGGGGGGSGGGAGTGRATAAAFAGAFRELFAGVGFAGLRLRAAGRFATDFREAGRVFDPERDDLATLRAGLRAEVRALEARRVFAITSARHACAAATVANAG
jgi:hypothetical protein